MLDLGRSGVGWGGDVNVHVKLQKHLMRRTRGVGWGGVGGVGSQVAMLGSQVAIHEKVLSQRAAQ